MSIIYCEHHDRNYDTDYEEECKYCDDEFNKEMDAEEIMLEQSREEHYDKHENSNSKN